MAQNPCEDVCLRFLELNQSFTLIKQIVKGRHIIELHHTFCVQCSVDSFLIHTQVVFN